MWTAWSKNPRPQVSPHSFWLQGRHRVEVRARRAGEPRSADLTPVVLETRIDTIDPPSGEVWAGEIGVAAGPAPFHGQAGEGGCGCQSNQDPGGGLVLVLGTLLLWSRRTRKLVAAAGVVLLAGMMPACNCGGDPPCGPVECMEGEVERGPIGRFNSVASDGERTVVSTYDERYGDLVFVDVTDEPIYVPVAGVPDEIPAYHPSGYRGGVVGEGPDVGAWTAIGLYDGRARIAFQDRDEGDLGFAVETDREWITYEIDANESETIGIHCSMAIQSDGEPAIAYLATDVDDGADGKKSVLRLARATSANPEDGTAWAIAQLAEGPAGCGGLCGAGRECIADDTGAERCVSASSDCTSTCADDEICVAASCTPIIGEPPVVDIPRGAGLFPTVMVLSDGRLAVTHYDRVRTALVLLVETSSGSSTFAETILDGADGADRGMWANAVTDGTTIHVAYQDALGDQLFYTTWSGSPGAIELVDDGVRAGDRTHPVGAGAAIFLDGGNPKIAYQDGLISDLVLATRAGNAWTHEGIATGTLIDGFHIAATSTGPWLVWDSMDKTRSPPSDLIVREQP
jgi:MYXO-CTERM domain-containing protein